MAEAGRVSLCRSAGGTLLGVSWQTIYRALEPAAVAT